MNVTLWWKSAVCLALSIQLITFNVSKILFVFHNFFLMDCIRHRRFTCVINFGNKSQWCSRGNYISCMSVSSQQLHYITISICSPTPNPNPQQLHYITISICSHTPNQHPQQLHYITDPFQLTPTAKNNIKSHVFSCTYLSFDFVSVTQSQQ